MGGVKTSHSLCASKPRSPEPTQSSSPDTTQQNATQAPLQSPPAADVQTPAENHNERNMPEPDLLWGERDGVTFCNFIESAYSEVVHWKHNIFIRESWVVICQRTGKLISSICCATALECMYRYTVSASSEATCQRARQKNTLLIGRED